MPLKCLTPYRHLQLIKRILHHIIAVQFIDSLHDNIHIRLLRLREQQELHPRKSLEATKSERRAFEHFNAGTLRGRDVQRGGCEGLCDGVDAVECAC